MGRAVFRSSTFTIGTTIGGAGNRSKKPEPTTAAKVSEQTRRSLSGFRMRSIPPIQRDGRRCIRPPRKAPISAFTDCCKKGRIRISPTRKGGRRCIRRRAPSMGTRRLNGCSRPGPIRTSHKTAGARRHCTLPSATTTSHPWIDCWKPGPTPVLPIRRDGRRCTVPLKIARPALPKSCSGPGPIPTCETTRGAPHWSWQRPAASVSIPVPGTTGPSGSSRRRPYPNRNTHRTGRGPCAPGHAPKTITSSLPTTSSPRSSAAPRRGRNTGSPAKTVCRRTSQPGRAIRAGMPCS